RVPPVRADGAKAELASGSHLPCLSRELSRVEATDRASSGARGGQGGLNAAPGETNPRPGTARLRTRVAHRPPPSARVAPVLLVRRPVRVVVPRSLRFRPGHLRGPTPA